VVDKSDNGGSSNNKKINFNNKPKAVYALVLLWIVLSVMFFIWGGYSLSVLMGIPSWSGDFSNFITSVLFFGFTMSSIVWLVFSSIFIIIAYGTLKVDSWVWTTSMIISTIFLAIFSLMLLSFIINILFYLNEFSKLGLVTTIITFIVDLGIIFFLTRPAVKLYFFVSKNK